MNNKQLRIEIYRNYGLTFQDTQDKFDETGARRWGRAYRYYLRGWLPLRKDAVIADLGCGQGRLLYFFKQQGYTNLYGADISPDQVACARQIIESVDKDDVLNWLSGRKKQFDLLVSLDLIEHFNREEALRFLNLSFEALKPGGRVVFQTPNADSPFGLQHRYNDITHEWAYNVNQLKRLLQRAGFEAIEAREQGPVPWGYSAASTLRWLIWRIIRAGLQLWNIAETGSRFPVLTRVLLISGKRSANPF